jgi:hypothetical protein
MNTWKIGSPSNFPPSNLAELTTPFVNSLGCDLFEIFDLLCVSENILWFW